MAKENAAASNLRWKKLGMVQAAYPSFTPFLIDFMDWLGFHTTEMQIDIGQTIEYGPEHLMIMAQRGEAKTTITAAFAVWTLIHSPSERILIVSAGETQANEISTLIIRAIMSWDLLECMRPDPQNGDRTSVEHFDIHYALKGPDKSPSVACVGAGGNLQGKRASLLIADDVESQKNSRTAKMREQLLQITRDFVSICDKGRIIYLGTPQSCESIYNTLPGRGFLVRIWPGRYPTAEQLPAYRDMLAPYILKRLKANQMLATGGGAMGDQGQSTDPERYSEEALQAKELDQGPSMFQLQYMLNTALMDKDRFPLRPEMCVVLSGIGNLRPLSVVRSFDGSTQAYTVDTHNFVLSKPHTIAPELAQTQGPIMYIDPAGGGANGDETAYCVTSFLNGNVFVHSWGGVPGGYRVESMERLAKLAAKHKVTDVRIEKNFGYGAFQEVFTPILARFCAAGVSEDMVHGQKELRIIETLEPVMARGALIFDSAAVQEDIDCTPANQVVYSGFFQMSRITRTKDSLAHDDRLDALEGATRYWQQALAQDQNKRIEALREAERMKLFVDPLGHQRCQPAGGRKQPSTRGSYNSYIRR